MLDTLAIITDSHYLKMYSFYLKISIFFDSSLVIKKARSVQLLKAPATDLHFNIKLTWSHDFKQDLEGDPNGKNLRDE